MELSQRARRVQLRLDSGQIVGAADRLGMVGLPATSAAILDLDQAFAAGKLPASLVDKLEEILQKLAAKVSGNGSYHLRTVNNVIHDQPPDTARGALATPRANGHAFADEPLSPTGTVADEGTEWAPGTFEQACLNLIRQDLNPMFGQEIIYFNRPVDLKYVPDYYKVIKRENARDLGTMSTKLSTHDYSSPQEFYDDMQLFFNNMILYNGIKAPFGVLAERVRKVFERKWAATPFGSGTRARRASAPVRRDVVDTPPEKRALGRAASAKSAGAAASRPTRAPKRTQEGGGSGGRAAKQQKTSGGSGPMPRARMQQLAQVLGELEGDDLNGVLQIIRESADLPDNGEIELDFDTLSQDTLWQLDQYLQTINKGTGQGGTFQLVESEESEEFDSDSDSD
mmetsp:Transcript_763/g.2334  ORF Transcript_763/g.2334 Transcript_763/m.2334 type:complete len:398 (-) Transcript_763:563-1756(-)